ncbi:MAG: hypothetical protein V1681_07045 [Candidatus Neomarinimicrobiota bacterium]
MSELNPNKLNSDDTTRDPWKKLYTVGAVAAIIFLLGTALDIIIGSTLGGNLFAVPETAVERFSEFQENWLLGLYHLDLLNMITAIIMIPAFLALVAAHRQDNGAFAILSLICFIIGTSIFIANNAALPMFQLSKKYAALTSESQKALLAAAGEALLAKGAHGSLGVFTGFALITTSDIIISLVMLTGKVFTKISAWTGILGSTLLLLYIVLVTFVPSVKSMAVAFSAPGGLLTMAWMVLFTARLFKLGCRKKS